MKVTELEMSLLRVVYEVCGRSNGAPEFMCVRDKRTVTRLVKKGLLQRFDEMLLLTDKGRRVVEWNLSNR